MFITDLTYQDQVKGLDPAESWPKETTQCAQLARLHEYTVVLVDFKTTLSARRMWS